jgi:hypothetical protein
MADLERKTKLMDSEIVLYQTEDGSIRIKTRIEDETVWLTSSQLYLV